MFKYELKTKAADKVTGYEGVITARCEYVSGENRYLIENIDATSRPVEHWVDESRIEIVEDFPFVR